MIFDSHAHYDDKQFDGDREELLSSMGKHRITKIVNVAASIDSSKECLALAEQYEGVYASIGVHPSEIACLKEEGIKWMREAALSSKAVAIGEIGLDYYWEKDAEVRKLQKIWFIRQLHLAREAQLPVIIHSRDSAEDTMEILKKEAAGRKGVLHCYSYSAPMALEYVDMGYYIGVGGVITFKNARKLKETVEAVPMEYILVETDCPYLSPEPYRGKRNTSLHLPYIIEEIAAIKKLSPEEVEEITYANAMKLYGLADV